MRAVRFASRFGFQVEAETRHALEAMAPQIKVVASERIAQELRKMLVHPNRAFAMRMLMDVGLVREILPELVPLVGHPSEQGHQAGQDRWDFTLSVLEVLPDEASFSVTLAALLHQAIQSEEEASASSVVACVADRLKLANVERNQASWLVAHHRALVEPRSLPVSRLKRLLAEPGIEELLLLHRAIAEAGGASTEHVIFCEHYLRDQPDGPIRPRPLLDGNDLKQLGLSPGPSFKGWLECAFDEQLEGRINDRDEAIAWFTRELKADDASRV